MRDLGYGTMYTLSWFEGTEYHEVKAPATCRVYKVDEAGRIIIPKSMNKDKGWAEYDLSQVPAGKYVVEGTTEYWHGVGAIIDVR